MAVQVGTKAGRPSQARAVRQGGKLQRGQRGEGVGGWRGAQVLWLKVLPGGSGGTGPSATLRPRRSSKTCVDPGGRPSCLVSQLTLYCVILPFLFGTDSPLSHLPSHTHQASWGLGAHGPSAPATEFSRPELTSSCALLWFRQLLLGPQWSWVGGWAGGRAGPAEPRPRSRSRRRTPVCTRRGSWGRRTRGRRRRRRHGPDFCKPGAPQSLPGGGGKGEATGPSLGLTFLKGAHTGESEKDPPCLKILPWLPRAFTAKPKLLTSAFKG